MTMMRPLAAVVLISACCFAAPVARSQAPREVSGVVVAGGPPPAVQSTYPTSGGRVPAGAVIVKIVFDQPMTADAWAYGPSAEGDFPKCLANPRLLDDQRTFALLCSLAPNRPYALVINFAPRFASAYGRSAKSFTLKFASTDADTPGVHDALLQAGLTDRDEPILTWHDQGRGVSLTATPP
jgi:hypothetical protein